MGFRRNIGDRRGVDLYLVYVRFHSSSDEYIKPSQTPASTLLLTSGQRIQIVQRPFCYSIENA